MEQAGESLSSPNGETKAKSCRTEQTNSSSCIISKDAAEDDHHDDVLVDIRELDTLDSREQDIETDVEERRKLCEPDRRQIPSNNPALPLTGRGSCRSVSNRESNHTATTELDSASLSSTEQKPHRKKPRPSQISDTFVIQYNDRYLKSCPGIFRLLQVFLSVISLISLTTSGTGKYDSYLLLPLSWHFRIMVFILVLTILTSLAMLVAYTTGLTATFPLNWPLMDLVLYTSFTFLYLTGSSLVASAVDFYQKMGTDVPQQTIRRLVICVVLGYMVMFINAATAIHGYKKWRWLVLHQFRRQRLVDSDEFV